MWDLKECFYSTNRKVNIIAFKIQLKLTYLLQSLAILIDSQ